MRKRITVVGDLMIDVDHIVKAVDERESRPRIIVQETRKRLGTAGAVAQMVAALGVDVTLVAVANEADAVTVKRKIQGIAFVVASPGITSRRERFYDPHWNVAGPRLDFDSAAEISGQDRRMMAGKILATVADAIIVCDHSQGVVGPELMEAIKTKDCPVFVDPHTRSDFSIFAGVEALVMNREEAEHAGEMDPHPTNIIEKLDADGLFWYLPGWQMEVVERGANPNLRQYLPSFARNVVDTLGAGDQFIAALTASRVHGDDMAKAIVKASAAAGIQCERRGVLPVTWPEIDARVREFEYDGIFRDVLKPN